MAFGTNGDRRGAYKCLWGNRRERSHLDDLSVDGRIILEWIFKKRGRGCVYRIYLSDDRDVEGFCEHCNEHSSTIRCGDVLDKLSNH